jgi:hypothetical protein
MKPIHKNIRFNPDKRKLMLNSSIALFIVSALLISSVFSVTLAAPPIRSGFNSSELARNDDRSTGLVDLGFPINFFGNTFSQGFVNNV